MSNQQKLKLKFVHDCGKEYVIVIPIKKGLPRDEFQRLTRRTLDRYYRGTICASCKKPPSSANLRHIDTQVLS